jgi:DNA modification methylase
MIDANTILEGDCIQSLKSLPDGIANTCITSPPYYGLRDYGKDGQIGLEETPEEYVQKLVEVFREVKRVLRDDGTLWLNLGDTYANTPVGKFNGGGFNDVSAKNGGRDLSGVATSGNLNKLKASGLKQKDLIGIPWMVAFALRSDGWYLRQDIIWHKTSTMPESVTDRCTKAHEYIFLLSKSKTYYYDAESIKEPVKQDWGTRDRTKGKYHNPGTGLNPHTGLQKSYEKANKRSVWTISPKPFHGAHFATFPPDLIEPCVIAGSPEGGIVLDPFFGSGTTGLVSMKNNRKYLGCELNSEYIDIAKERLKPVETEIKNKEIAESLIQNYFQF